MIRLLNLSPNATTLQSLSAYQTTVDAAGAYPARVASAKAEFKSKNTSRNAAFRDVKATLDRMCAGARRCGYCEDSMADEVEHIRPKDLYPEAVFAWTNYLYACGPCNGPKSNQFAVFPEGRVDPVEVSRRRNDPVVPPLAGDEVLIDPRRDDPMEFMILDLQGTFRFVPLAVPGTRQHARAKYTIDVLRLNTRDVLPRARREAFEDYCNALVAYRDARDNGASPQALAAKRTGLLGKQHPSVFREMQRQWESHRRLLDLFAGVPEALRW